MLYSLGKHFVEAPKVMAENVIQSQYFHFLPCGNHKNSVGKSFVKSTDMITQLCEHSTVWKLRKFTLTHSQCGNCRNSLSHFFGKNFVKATFLLKKLVKRWFDEIFFGESKFFILPHCGFQLRLILIVCHDSRSKPNLG